MCPLTLKRQVAIHPGFVVAVAAAVMLALAVVVVMAAHDRVLLVSTAVVEDVARCSVSAACQRTLIFGYAQFMLQHLVSNPVLVPPLFTPNVVLSLIEPLFGSLSVFRH